MTLGPVDKGVVVEVVIEDLGAEGDGIARVNGKPLYVPFALPGERLRVRVHDRHRDFARGRIETRLGPARGRPPACRHFGHCGGCRLQHLPQELYEAFRVRQVVGELARRRIACPKPQLVWVPPGSRRRLRLAWQRGRHLRLGFRALQAHTIIDLLECPVAVPQIVALLPALRLLLAQLAVDTQAGEVVVTRFASGLDLLLRLDQPIGQKAREQLAAFAADHKLSRLAVAVGTTPPEPIVVREPPSLRLGPLLLPVPADAFLQATEVGERALQNFISRALPEGARLVDLFAGLGVLSLPLWPRLKALTLVEGHAGSVEALQTASRRAALPRLAVVGRDLERRPLTAAELAAFDAVVVDPPRAGARAQVAEIAASPIGLLLYVSCNPATFARDARILVDAGFVITELMVVDQFLWSAEVELAACFARPTGKPEGAAAWP